jgi:hypothetical protein
MRKNVLAITTLCGLVFLGWWGYYLFIGKKKVDPKLCITSGQWQLQRAYLDSFLYINDPNRNIAPQLLKHIDVTEMLINKKNVLLDLNIEAKGFGMYGDAKIRYTGTPFSISYSASAPGTRTSGYCRNFIELKFGSWLNNNEKIYDTIRVENRIDISEKKTQNFEGRYSFSNDTLTCNIGYSSYDSEKSFSNFIDLKKVLSTYGDNKEFILKWIRKK